MAVRSNGPMTLALPPFRGVVRRILLVAVLAFFAEIILTLAFGNAFSSFVAFLALVPHLVVRGALWELVTYPFVRLSLLGLLLPGFFIWFAGGAVEDERGSRWFAEYFLATTIGGGALAAVIACQLHDRVSGIDAYSAFGGLGPVSMAVLLAYARFFAEQEILFLFLVRMKAKHLAAITLLIYLASLLTNSDRMGALLVLSNALCGFLFLRFAPYRGMGFAVSERWYGLRNAFYRNKRKKAAKKFEVYMRDQGKDVRMPSDEGRNARRDPNDRKWMN